MLQGVVAAHIIKTLRRCRLSSPIWRLEDLRCISEVRRVVCLVFGLRSPEMYAVCFSVSDACVSLGLRAAAALSSTPVATSHGLLRMTAAIDRSGHAPSAGLTISHAQIL